MERLTQTNLDQTSGYGTDPYCMRAASLIREACGAENADVHFLVGGTQTNMTVISSILRPHQGVVCAAGGHISIHESGAIEHSGHKVLTLESADCRITAEQIETCVRRHFDDESAEHMVQPGMVYISFPSELGTVYSLRELEEISSVCRSHGLPLYVDGARLGYGLAASDVTLQDVARLADVFYIGGTKQGALLGEAVVFTDRRLSRDFRYFIKMNGGMLAKGRIVGIQFETLFEDGLYMSLSRHAVSEAMRLRDAFLKAGFSLHVDSPTNQQFPILPQSAVDALSSQYGFSLWERVEGTDRWVTRFCTSWATDPADVDRLAQSLMSL